MDRNYCDVVEFLGRTQMTRLHRLKMERSCDRLIYVWVFTSVWAIREWERHDLLRIPQGSYRLMKIFE